MGLAAATFSLGRAYFVVVAFAAVMFPVLSVFIR
jgi:hypothetical protein